MTEPAPHIRDYRLGARLGGGNYGDVYRATHAAIGREVAIKILHADRCGDPDAVARFLVEARAANLVRHPNIVEVVDFGALPDGRYYCVMELLQGTTLQAVLEQRGALPWGEARPLLRAIAEAVDAAHAAGVAHRDVKPENVMVLDGGGIKLIDFGLAKLAQSDVQTRTGAMLGTPRYMAPEQCLGKASDAQADLYSFGALAYHVVSGAPPFSGDALALALHHVNDVPPRASTVNPAVGAGIDAVLSALLDKTPARRPRPLAPLVDAMSRPPRRRWPWAVAALAVAAGVALLAWPRGAPVARSTWPATPVAIGQPHVWAPTISADGEVSFMNEHGLWRYRDGQVSLIDAHASYRSQFADGSWLTTHESAREGPSIWYAGKQLSLGAWAEASTAGPRFVFVRDGNAFLATVDAPEQFQLPLRLDDSAGKWDPAGQKGIATTAWLRGPKGSYTAISGYAGFIPLDLATLAGPPQLGSIAFVTSQSALYCGADGTLRIRDLTSGRDRDVMALPEGTGSCDLAVARGGQRAFVSANLVHESAHWLDPRTGGSVDASPAPVDAARSCAGGACATVSQVEDRLEVRGDDGRAIASAPAAWAKGRWPLLGLSPTEVAIGARGARQVVVIDRGSGAARTIELPASHGDQWMPPTAVDGLAWIGDELYASGAGVDGARYGIYRLDAARTPIWRSDTVRVRLDGRVDDGRLGIVEMAVESQPMWVDLTGRPKPP